MIDLVGGILFLLFGLFMLVGVFVPRFRGYPKGGGKQKQQISALEQLLFSVAFTSAGIYIVLSAFD